MGTCNFYAKNHRGSIYRVSDECTTLDDDDNEIVVQNDFLIEDTIERLQWTPCNFPLEIDGKTWDNDLNARVIAEGDEWIKCYPNHDNGIFELNFNSFR